MIVVPARRDVDDPLLQPRLASLDGLRFLAVALVVAYHGGLEFPAPDGVTLFFVLSGLLFAVLLDREYQRTGNINLRSFYARRAWRILPAFYVALLATAAGKLLLDNPVDVEHAIASGLFVGNYYNVLHGHPPTGFAHFWSLAVEEQFYLLWPVTFLALARVSRRALLTFLGVSIAAVCAWRSTMLWSGLGSDPYAYDAFECRFDSLATGCLLGLMLPSTRFRRVIHRTCRTGLEPLLLVALLVWSTSQSKTWHHGVGFTLDSAVMGLLLLQLVVLGGHPLWRWLNWRGVKCPGLLSYSAYLLHGWGLELADEWEGLPLGIEVALGLAATMFLAAGMYFVVERPALLCRDRMASRIRAA